MEEVEQLEVNRWGSQSLLGGLGLYVKWCKVR